MRWIIFALLLPTTATAGQIDADLTKRVLSEGNVISAVPITPPPPANEILGPATPEGTRIHEAFIAYEASIYLCYLRGGTAEGVRTLAYCYD